MNVLAFEKRERPPAPDWRPEGTGSTYLDILIDGLPLAEHLLDAARRSGVEEEIDEHGPLLIVRKQGHVETVSFYNYLSPVGWGNPDWDESWVTWALAEEPSPFLEGALPLLACGYCGDCEQTLARVTVADGVVRWSDLREIQTLVLPDFYRGLEFNFDEDDYRAALRLVRRQRG